MRKVIISVAPVGGADPVCPDALAEDVARCAGEGASICHLHAKTREGVLSPDISILTECFEKIGKHCDIIAQASTGGISRMNIQQRCHPLKDQRVESASLNGGSCNLGEDVYCNSFEDIRYCAKEVYARRILPEFEVFEIGMIYNILTAARELPFQKPLLFNLVFGHRGEMPSTVEHLFAFTSFLPKGPDTYWGITHYGRSDWDLIAAAIAMGANLVRIGFEDSKWLDEGQQAEKNHQLVHRLTCLIRAMGREPATPKEARQMLRIHPHPDRGQHSSHP